MTTCDDRDRQRRTGRADDERRPLETTLTDQRLRLAKRVGQHICRRRGIRESSNDRQADRPRQNPQPLTSVLDGRLSVAISASGQAGA
jgi:hypothetical protein